jgi:predicted MPP superfamily phosphohydrolase
LLALLAVWSFGIEPRWVAQRHVDVRVPGWQRPPLKVAVASDWHLTRSAWRVMTPDHARRIVDAINAAQPDLILLPGDFISGWGDPVAGALDPDEIAAILGRLRAPLGVHAVLGNHDWWHDGPAVAAALERRGIRVLENRATAVDAGLWLAGIGDRMTGHSRPAQASPRSRRRAVAAADARPREPAGPAARAGLRVCRPHPRRAGRAAGLGALIVPGDAPRGWSYGWIEHAGVRGWVTSGLGISILPVRFNRRPEWMLFTIDAALG